MDITVTDELILAKVVIIGRPVVKRKSKNATEQTIVAKVNLAKKLLLSIM
jgi:hypothetical protein